MPRVTDSDLNRRADRSIIVSQNKDCPRCDAPFDVEFDTGARDEDGLADVVPGDLTVTAQCPSCDHEFTTEYDGWLMFGEPG